MSTLPDPPQGHGRTMDTATVVLVAILGTVLVSGFVVLSALGRDTTSYLLFLGGPAVTGIVGAVLNRRVAVVADVVETAAASTKAVVEDTGADLDRHLSEQDEVLGAAARSAAAAHRAVAGPVPGLPAARRSDEQAPGPTRPAAAQRARGAE